MQVIATFEPEFTSPATPAAPPPPPPFPTHAQVQQGEAGLDVEAEEVHLEPKV